VVHLVLRIIRDRLCRHASIDPAVRAARGLPEDLIRLCVGIEDAEDLLYDLEGALLEAGAITLIRDANGEESYTRIGYAPAIRSLTERVNGLGLEDGVPVGEEIQREWLVSAPGKVILFGEHAVVHGVVSEIMPGTSCLGVSDVQHDALRPRLRQQSIYVAMVI
jgi:hypothetical protein